MRGTVGQAQALIRISSRDKGGNWPMELQVTGLPKQSQRVAYYELWLTQGPQAGRAVRLVPGQRRQDHRSLHGAVRRSSIDGWVVTAQPNGTPEPGPVVLTHLAGGKLARRRDV